MMRKSTGRQYIVSTQLCNACLLLLYIIDCESCTWPISTKPASMEVGGLGLTCGACFVVRHLDLVVVIVCLSAVYYCVIPVCSYCTSLVARAVRWPISTKPASIYGSGRAWANVWGLFRGTTSRPGRGRRAAVFWWCVLIAAGFRGI